MQFKKEIKKFLLGFGTICLGILGIILYFYGVYYFIGLFTDNCPCVVIFTGVIMIPGITFGSYFLGKELYPKFQELKKSYLEKKINDLEEE